MKVFFVLVLIFSSGCAFKEPHAAAPTADISSSEQSSLKSESVKTVGEAIVSFPQGSRLVEKKLNLRQQSGLMRGEKAIFLPVSPPDKILVSIHGVDHEGSKLETPDVLLKKRDAAPVKLDVKSLEDGFEISGLTSFLSTTEESHVILNIALGNSVRNSSVVEFSLSTPPSRLDRSETTVDELLKEKPELAETIQSLKEEGLSNEKIKLELVQIFKTQNPSHLAVQVVSPVRIRGHVWQQIDVFNPKSNGCRWDSGEAHSTESLSRDLYLLPIYVGIQNDFHKILKGTRTSNSQTVSLGGAQSLAWGVFAQGGKISSRTKSKTNPLAVTTCYAKCIRNFHVARGVPGDACQRCSDSSWGSCDECKAISDRYPELRICEEWGLGYATTSVRTGTQSSTYLELDPSNSKVRLRFEDPTADEFSERSIQILNSKYQLD